MPLRFTYDNNYFTAPHQGIPTEGYDVLAQRLLAGRKRFRLLALILVLLPFFSSMLITNDVSLISLVPVTILVLGLIRH